MTRIVWFRNDLRTGDHPGLSAHGLAASAPATRDIDALLPVFIFPPRLFSTTGFGFPKVGPHRAQFLLETLDDLRGELRRRGSDLIICRGSPATVLPTLAKRYAANEIWYQEEAGTEEAAEVAELETALASRKTGEHEPSFGAAGGRGKPGTAATPQLRPHHGQTLYHPSDLPFSIEEMPLIYTDFRKAVEKSATIRGSLPPPAALPRLPAPPAELLELLEKLHGVSAGPPDVEQLSGSPPPEPDSRAAIHFTGGETAGRDRLNAYFWERDELRRYKHTRNGLLGADYSSKFSPWLANGAVSPRSIVEEVRRYEAERVKNSSTYWLVFELIWRDYFAFLLRRFADAIFRFEGPMRRRFPWTNDREAFSAWKEGRTGQDFIDANMLEIAATGYMSNRGRQNVASYLARDMKVNWLIGAEYFESQLIDYDPGSNYGNWTYNVGVGTDPRHDRYFNPRKQAEKYDADGRYRRHWLGERVG
ncbi:MAG: DASH family cryptochrome [Spirochaetes bacterium]|jgi:deoxyribodipyrimidine photo-lyase|nr:DASH family cryptochrome [Spirochaetota bacterium]